MSDIDLFTPEIVGEMLPDALIETIENYLPLLLQALGEQGLDDRVMILIALATIRAETDIFKPISEYRSKYNTANSPYDKYDWRTDLGNQGTGDGAKFKGRGFIQLTGRYNYRNYGRALGVDLETEPDLANDPLIAARLLALFLKDREAAIRSAIENGDMKSARRLVNGGSYGLDKFTQAFDIGEELT